MKAESTLSPLLPAKRQFENRHEVTGSDSERGRL
jgi:hypothetical protein